MIIQLKIMYGNTKIWRKNGKIHRDNNLPAVIFNSGRKIYYENSKAIKEESK